MSHIYACVHAKLLQLCPTVCDPMDHSLPGSSLHGDSPGRNTGVENSYKRSLLLIYFIYSSVCMLVPNS